MEFSPKTQVFIVKMFKLCTVFVSQNSNIARKQYQPKLVLNNVRGVPKLPKHTIMMRYIFKVSLMCPKRKEREHKMRTIQNNLVLTWKSTDRFVKLPKSHVNLKLYPSFLAGMEKLCLSGFS